MFSKKLKWNKECKVVVMWHCTIRGQDDEHDHGEHDVIAQILTEEMSYLSEIRHRGRRLVELSLMSSLSVKR